jgi:hypothetical protein
MIVRGMKTISVGIIPLTDIPLTSVFPDCGFGTGRSDWSDWTELAVGRWGGRMGGMRRKGLMGRMERMGGPGKWRRIDIRRYGSGNFTIHHFHHRDAI